MSTTLKTERGVLLSRILDEGYGPGAWHGADLKAAMADVTPEQALWRPSDGRHNIAEIALHHAYYVHSVRERLTGVGSEPFAVAGADWFEVPGVGAPGWSEIRELLADEQSRLVATVAALEAGRATSPLVAAERADVVLGITCHAIYHAGQIQLLKRLHGG